MARQFLPCGTKDFQEMNVRQLLYLVSCSAILVADIVWERNVSYKLHMN